MFNSGIFSVAGPDLWNSPTSSFSSVNALPFKSKLKTNRSSLICPQCLSFPGDFYYAFSEIQQNDNTLIKDKLKTIYGSLMVLLKTKVIRLSFLP